MSHIVTAVQTSGETRCALSSASGHRIVEIEVSQRGRSSAVKLYMVVCMTMTEMAEHLPHRSSCQVLGASVAFWGDYRDGQPCWSGIRDFHTSPLRAFLAPHVADAAADEIGRREVRELLHTTGFRERNASPVEVMRFIAGRQT